MIKPRLRSPKAPPPNDPGTPPATKNAEVLNAIGRELQALFNGIATEPVPDRFRNLLDELERKLDKE